MQRQISSQRASLTKSNGGMPFGPSPKVSVLVGWSCKWNTCNIQPAFVSSPCQPIIRYMPSYRLDPKNPLNKERLELLMKDVMDRNYNEEYLWHPKQSYQLAAQVSEEIKNSIKLMNFDR